ncbi:hypothetical protein HPB51_011465 [Rhipicephalus microplus]|uniref:adenylate cyclase n=1 Tax=Rhipicephalus microplus TaxID=6941 RepID=A0A9J6DUF5_RHIMP|nr:hypothetical protein HPB51_011465 [Rhipicephalus microplus]
MKPCVTQELYSKSHDFVGVLFAAMPNFSDFYTEESVNNQGLECLRFLNEVISDFDASMLSSYRSRGSGWPLPSRCGSSNKSPRSSSLPNMRQRTTPASKRECPSPAADASPSTESKYKVVVKSHTSMKSAGARTYKCGLCQTYDRNITLKDCTVKQKALKAHRRRKHHQCSVTKEERDADIPTSNRFKLLSPSEVDTPALAELGNACYEDPTYSDAMKRGKKRVQQAASTPKSSVTTTDDLAKPDQQIAQLQKEVKRLAQCRTHPARPAAPTVMRDTDVPYAASVPQSSSASASASVKMTPAELLQPSCSATARAVKGGARQPPTAMTTPSKATHHHCALPWSCRGLPNKVGEHRCRLVLGKLPAWCLFLQEMNSLPRIPGFLRMLPQPPLIDAAPMRWDFEARLQCMLRLHIPKRKFPYCRGVSSGREWRQYSLDFHVLTSLRFQFPCVRIVAALRNCVRVAGLPVLNLP